MDNWHNIYKEKAQEYEYYKIHESHEDMAQIRDVLQKAGCKTVLDVGVGAGRNAVFLAEAEFSVWGIDRAQAGLDLAKATAEQKKLTLNLLRGDVYDALPYKDAFFDAVISVQVLQHNTHEHIQNAISEIYRILKPGGVVFVTVCGRYSKGKVRHCLVKTAEKIAQQTYVPRIGDEAGLTHYIFTKKQLLSDFKQFETQKLWKDSRDYYCLLAKKPDEKLN